MNIQVDSHKRELFDRVSKALKKAGRQGDIDVAMYTSIVMDLCQVLVDSFDGEQDLDSTLEKVISSMLISGK
ncbi:hypothetical protein [Marinomonas sp. 2405UD68-3]|uniref:hypothetical protein n=1 Tax=Marinomonas sp. 2405UD68-3 TaxID=3391835 RepID=UPI0039C976BB